MPLSDNIVIRHALGDDNGENGEIFTQKQRIRGKGWTSGVWELAYVRERERERERENNSEDKVKKEVLLAVHNFAQRCVSLTVFWTETESLRVWWMMEDCSMREAKRVRRPGRRTILLFSEWSDQIVDCSWSQTAHRFRSCKFFFYFSSSCYIKLKFESFFYQ